MAMEIEGPAQHGATGWGSRERDERGAYVVWEELTVVLPNYGDGPTRRLLDGLNGYAEPGRILAIMGPSGSGKSTLLDSLAGRLAGNTIMSGNVLVNGRKKKLDYGAAAYVTQEDILLGTLTVRETIMYSAQLRLPKRMSSEEKKGVVEGTIMAMGLQECADTPIGNWHLRGVSGGEKKRISIAQQILTRPRILFLDEPTSGLDSASAFFVTQTLRSLARDGRTVLASLHQPSSEVFALFDDLFLLSGGQTVYFGDAHRTTEFFKESGFPCPSRRNPSDHFLRCINSDFDRVTATLLGSRRILETEASDPLLKMRTAEIKSILVDKFRVSEYATSARARMHEISLIENLVMESSKGSEASWWMQLTTLTRRSFINMSRDIGYYWLRVVIYVLVSLCVGTIYFDVGTSYTAILARSACGAFISGFMTFMSIGGFPSFVEEMKVFYGERRNGFYGVSVYILSNFLSSFPYLVLVSLSSGSITYYMVKFQPGYSRFIYFSLNLFGCLAVIESLMMVVASLVPNFLMGIITGAGIMGILMMTAGFFRLLPDLPKPFWRYPISYLSYGSWGLQGQLKNDMIGMLFDPMLPGDPKLRGEDILRNMLGVGLGHSKWLDLAIIYVILISYRLTFFLVLKFNEKVSPALRSLHAKRSLEYLKRRPSFTRKPSFRSTPSFRYTTPHALSTQEGLNSPLQ
ncbi:ABC transporter G family member 15 isoform X2 [Amborella trichopoda]|uniref:ABC transporter domain-containing protein n=1 Tax=Amborella trichopoda TaxID=13333 RepID=W1P005_AMBTC|nr:ABC transporter G family member 15 isoform X2 [Amborella trichopoda]ERN00275.1 hypothetical protein AMTR_s00107p00013610 [Amborella trichopoda]|eukprot:XP_006837421.1 ABC transporter G family member 15 isoform X2 [Amborella trichopoda]